MDTTRGLVGPPPDSWTPPPPLQVWQDVTVVAVNTDTTEQVNTVTVVGDHHSRPAGQQDTLTLNDSTLAWGQVQDGRDGRGGGDRQCPDLAPGWDRCATLGQWMNTAAESSPHQGGIARLEVGFGRGVGGDGPGRRRGHLDDQAPEKEHTPDACNSSTQRLYRNTSESCEATVHVPSGSSSAPRCSPSSRPTAAQPDNPGRDRRKAHRTAPAPSSTSPIASSWRRHSQRQSLLSHSAARCVRCGATPTSVVAPVCVQPVEGLSNRFAHVVGHLAAIPT